MCVCVCVCMCVCVCLASISLSIYLSITHTGGARGVVVIVVGNRQGDTSSNPGRD